MSDPASTTRTAGTRLRAGDRLATQSVLGFVCSDALGERHETVFGSTTHLLDVCVPPAGASSPTAADYAAFVERVSRVRHPCVVRYFASGEAAPRDGAEPVPWLRCEHQEGAPASVLATAVDPAGLPTDENGRPRVPTFADLLASCGGRLSPKDRDAILGDVLDGLAHLHSLGLPCGHLAPEEIALGHVRHRALPRARIRVYAWPPDGDPADLSADFVLAAPLFRAALDASTAVSKPREAEALAAFADKLGAGGFETAAAAAAGFAALCAGWGRPRTDPADEGDDPSDDESSPAEESAARGASDSRRPPRRHRKPESAFGSEVMRRAMVFVGIFAVIAFIVGVGVAVYFYLSATAEAERRRVSALSGGNLPAILVIPTERASADLLAELPPDVFDYTPAQLELAAAAAGDPRAPAAKARAVLEALDAAGPGAGAGAFREAAAKMAEVLPALRAAASSDPASELLLGRAMLLGLGTPLDPAGGYKHVLKASLDGLREGDLILGDVLASGVKVPDLRAESRVGRDRRAVAAWRRASGTDTAPTPQLRRAADRIAPMLHAGRGIPPASNDYRTWLGRLATAGHEPSLVALSSPGGIASDDPAEALKWLRILARLQTADPARRAWAQFRMARAFERGEGTPEPDPKAALVWYRRAAEAGSLDAMKALRRLLHDGTPEERKEAAKWSEASKSASPAPGLPFVSSLVEPPSAAKRAAVPGADAPAPKTAAAGAVRPMAPSASAKPSSGGAANRAAVPLSVRRIPRRPAVVLPDDSPLVPLTVESEDASETAVPKKKPVPKKKKPLPKTAVPQNHAPQKIAPGKKGAWPPKGARVDPVRKKDSAK